MCHELTCGWGNGFPANQNFFSHETKFRLLFGDYLLVIHKTVRSDYSYYFASGQDVYFSTCFKKQPIAPFPRINVKLSYPYYVKDKTKSKRFFTENDIISLLEFLIDNIIIEFGWHIYK